MSEYKKLKCVMCGYEMVSKAKSPKCSHCGSRRFNAINEFSNDGRVKKPQSNPPTNNETTQQQPPEPKHKGFWDDVNKDFE